VIDNFNIKSRFGRLFIPAYNLASYAISNNSSANARNTDPSIMKAVDATAADTGTAGGLVEWAHTGIVVADMVNDGDIVSHFMGIPTNWDLTQDIQIRPVWVSDSSDAADFVDWKGLFDVFAIGDAIAAPSTALDTGFFTSTGDYTTTGTANQIEVALGGTGGSNGVILASNFGEDSAYLAFSLEMDSADANISDLGLLGIEISFNERFTGGRDGKLPNSDFGTDGDRFQEQSA